MQLQLSGTRVDQTFQRTVKYSDKLVNVRLLFNGEGFNGEFNPRREGAFPLYITLHRESKTSGIAQIDVEVSTQVEFPLHDSNLRITIKIFELFDDTVEV